MPNLERGLIQSPVKLLDAPSDNKGEAGGSPVADVSTGKKISRRDFLNLAWLTAGGLLAGCIPASAATLEDPQIPLDPTPRSAAPPTATATPTDGPTSTSTRTAMSTETPTSTVTETPTATPTPEFWGRPVVTKVEIPVADGWNNKHEIGATITTEDDSRYGKVFRFDSVGDKVKMERRGQLDWDKPLRGLPNRPYSLYFPVKVKGELEDLSVFTSFNGIELSGPSERGDTLSLQYMLNLWPSGLHIVAYYWRSHQGIAYPPLE